MVNTRGNSQRNGTSDSVTPPGALNGAGNAVNNPMPPRGLNQGSQQGRGPNAANEGTPNAHEMVDMIRELRNELRETQDELRQARAEKDNNSREERTEGSYSQFSRRTQHSASRTPTAPRKDKVVNRPGDNERDNNVQPKEFSYEKFTKSGAKEFDGTLDAVGCMEWLDDTEVVFASCDCPEEKKVLFASRMLKKSARDWWKGTTVSLTPGVLAAMPWETFREKFLDEYCGTRERRLLEKEFLTLKKGDKSMAEYARSFMEKLKFVGHLVPTEEAKIAAYVDGLPASHRGICRQHSTLSDAIKESKRLEDDFKTEKVVRNDDKKNESKRKFDGSSGSGSKKYNNNNDGDSKGRNEKEEWTYCATCKSKHTGACSIRTMRCAKCTGMGHMAKDCTNEARCYNCKQTGHQKTDCPRLKNAENKDNRNRTTARAYNMYAEETQEEDEGDN